MALVAEGLSNEEIAARLVVSPATAKTHVSQAMVKLSARDRAQLVVLAYESGLVRPGWVSRGLRPTGTAAPFTFTDRSEQSQSAAAAKPSAVPGPYATALMRTSRSAWSSAAARVRPITHSASSERESAEFTTTPPPDRSSAGSSYLIAR
jgi:hypothetical protein